MMKTVILVLVFVMVKYVITAPTLIEEKVPDTVVLNRIPQENFSRDKRSKFEMPYMPPCAAASSASVPTYAPANYHYNIPYQTSYGYGMPEQYAYPPQRYRSEDSIEAEELLNFSDMSGDMSEQFPMSRFVTFAPTPPATHVNIHPAPMSPHPAQVMSLPNTLTGCNIPLVFACTPSIVPGRLVQPQYSVGSVPNAYRGVNDFHVASHEAQDTSTNVHPIKGPDATQANASHQ